jgi:uncharacterized damage-inducible protein DinB
MVDEPTTAGELRDSLSRYKSGREATLELVANLEDTQADRAPDDGGWSVAQVLDHLLKIDETYRVQIGKLFELEAAGAEAVREVSLRELNPRPPFVPAAVLPHMDVPFRLMSRLVPSGLREYLTGLTLIPFQTPDSAAPQPEGGIEDARRRLRASEEETAALISSRDVSGMVMDHPLLGRNDVPGLVRILIRHEERHRGQISRLLPAEPEAARAPAGGVAIPSLQSLADDADEALSTGRQLVSWWRTKAREDALELFHLRPAYPPYYEMQAFFDSIVLQGDVKPTSIMGCLQRHRFKRRRAPAEDTTRHLESFIDQRFLAQCFKTHPDGTPGGFRYRPICFRESKSGRLLEPPDPEALGMDLASLRNGLEWGVLRVDILDFVRVNELLARYEDTLSHFMRESAYIVIHEDLACEPTKAPKDVVAERRFGYAFLPREVEPLYLGFGPGKFGAAVKQWRFLLFLNGDVEVRVAFLVAPRSQKVLDFGGFDPVYTSVRLAEAFSMGALGLDASAHAALDRVFLEHHGVVHADIVLGLAEVWEGQRWTPSFGSW